MIVTRAATGPNGELSANIANLFGTQTVQYSPSSGTWTETLPGLPGLGPQAGGTGLPGGQTRQQYCQRIYDACHKGAVKADGTIDEDFERGCVLARDNCLKGAALDTGLNAGACASCSVSNWSSCIDCAWIYISHAGIEIGLVALLLLGLYLWLK